ncbi:hypothetical protein BABINDRAFT_160759 [Babjeviella inositovora NRRL Y-12698]|uniref:Uncharacterized protein n=1 Tax=Babjeviella inositovora NRRL Y-12698 TaxID=984486 RepID=A0A1E3QS38_9ASCO|nr:uncharacterized protein BABINDRAFT_160759 [Babjeviella inositovora NRRL Y-12698]ODQ80480.1 hypothetical protein BABINDRAFT_160759 [Babjeviella inositovora NRRL Y-12698]
MPRLKTNFMSSMSLATSLNQDVPSTMVHTNSVGFSIDLYSKKQASIPKFYLDIHDELR